MPGKGSSVSADVLGSECLCKDHTAGAVGDDVEELHGKTVSVIKEPDIAISMGCNVECPFASRPFDDNWGLEDPTGQSDDVFKEVIERIEKQIIELKTRL